MKKKKWIIVSLLFLGLLLGSNCAWYRVWKKEIEKLKHAVIPTLTNDYYSNQLALTKNAKLYNQEYENEIEELGVFEEELYYFQTTVPLVLQNPKYPNGCEAAAAVMLLQYFQIDISLEEFVDQYLLTDEVYEKEGIRYGPNPALYYAGQPADETRGWGCFSPVIASAIQKVINDKKDHQVMFGIAQSDEKFPLPFYLNEASPVMIWTTIEYQEAKEVYEWLSYDRKNTYTYPKNSHAVVVTGYDGKYYYINDPLKTETNIPVSKKQLEASFDSLGRQALILYQYFLTEEEIQENTDKKES